MIGGIFDWLASPSPRWLTESLLWVGFLGLVVIAVAKSLTVVLLSLIRDKLPLDKATIFNQGALLQVVILALTSQTFFAHVGIENRPTWAQLWWLETWLVVAVSGIAFLWHVWLERVKPMWWDRFGGGRGR